MKQIFFICITLAFIFPDELTITYSVDGMMCAVSCPKKIDDSLYGVEGVKSSKVNFESKTVIVTFDDKKINSKKIAKLISSNTYFKIQDLNEKKSFTIWEWLFGTN